MRRDRGRTEAGRHRTGRDEARLKRHGAQQQIPAHHQLGPQHRRVQAQRNLFRQQRPDEHRRRDPLPHQVGHRGARQLQPRHSQPAVHQQRTQHRRHRESGHDVAQRTHGVLHTAHPAVAGQRDEDRGRSQDRDPQPRQRRLGDLAAAGDHRQQRHRNSLHDREDQHTEQHCQPGGLDAFADRRGPVPSTVEPRRARRGSVGQEGQLRTDEAEHQAADRQAGEAERTQPADDRDVE